MSKDSSTCYYHIAKQFLRDPLAPLPFRYYEEKECIAYWKDLRRLPLHEGYLRALKLLALEDTSPLLEKDVQLEVTLSLPGKELYLQVRSKKITRNKLLKSIAIAFMSDAGNEKEVPSLPLTLILGEITIPVADFLSLRSGMKFSIKLPAETFTGTLNLGTQGVAEVKVSIAHGILEAEVTTIL